MKTLKDKRILILLISLLPLFFFIYLHQPDLHHSNSEDFQAWAKEDIQVWLDKNHVSLEDWESFVEALRSVEIRRAEHLSDAQKTAYWEALVDFLQAHREGTREGLGAAFDSAATNPAFEAPTAFIMSCEILSLSAGFS